MGLHVVAHMQSCHTSVTWYNMRLRDTLEARLPGCSRIGKPAQHVKYWKREVK